jgi:hypothetical protein
VPLLISVGGVHIDFDPERPGVQAPQADIGPPDTFERGDKLRPSVDVLEFVLDYVHQRRKTIRPALILPSSQQPSALASSDFHT